MSLADGVGGTARGDLIRGSYLFAVALFLMYGVVLLSHREPAKMNDFADWTYEGVMLHDTLVGRPPAHAVLKHYPVPNSLQTVGIALLCFVMPGELAGKVWIVFYLLGALLTWRYMARTAGYGVWPAWLILPGAFVGLDFWYGLLSFLLGVLWITMLVAVLLRLKGQRREWLCGVLLVLAFFTHMIPCALGCLLLGCFVVQTRRWKLLWQAGPAAVLTGWYVVGRFLLDGNADGQSGMVETVHYLSGAFWLFKVNTYLKSFDFVNPSVDGVGMLPLRLGGAGYSVVFLLNALMALVVLVAMVRAARRAFRDGRRERFFWVAAGLSVPLILLLPAAALGISDPGSRVLQGLLWTGLWLMVEERRLLYFAGVAAMLISGVNAWQWSTLAFRPVPATPMAVSPLPRLMVEFGRVPYGSHYAYYQALERGDMSLRVWPTGMFAPK